MKKYLESHINRYYLPNPHTLPGLTRYENSYGWNDYYIGSNILFSHRKNLYGIEVFPEKLHTHRFYEIVIYFSGNVTYVADSQEFSPKRDDILIFPPHCQHTARMLEAGIYDRYVFHFSADILDFLGAGILPQVYRSGSASCLSVVPNKRAEFYYLRERLLDTLHSQEEGTAMQAFCYILHLLHLIGCCTQVNRSSIAEIPQKVLDVKHYVDHNFKDINTTAEIAAHFFYSREYVSRVFKQYYNINLSEHLINQKINHAKQLLRQGNSATYAYAASGFRSMSAFVNAFRARTGMTPAEYKRAAKNKK